MQTIKISRGLKKIKNWHLSFLVLIASVLSIGLVNNYVFAQWTLPPDNPPESGSGNIVVTPMVQDLNLNDHNIEGDNIIIDPNASDVLRIDNATHNAEICFNGACKNAWPSGTALDYWSAAVDGNSIYRPDYNVGIQDSSPVSALTVGNGDLFQVNAAGDIVRINNIPYTWPDWQGASGNSTFLRNDGNGNLGWSLIGASGGDDLGSHIATKNIQTSGWWLSNDGADEGLWVSASGNVGIGTNVPNKQLHVKTASGNAEIDIQSVASPYWGIYQDDGTDDLRFWNVDNRVTFKASGNVGIGEINPSAKLEVAGDLEIANLEDNAGANFFGPDCGLDNYVYGINSDGTLDCRPDLAGAGAVDEATVEGYIFDIDPANVLGIWTYLSRPAFYGGDSTNPPFSVDSNIKVTNLNADLLDGLDSSVFQDDIGANCASGNYAYGVSDAGVLLCSPDLSGAGVGDNLGDHVADLNIILGLNYLSGDGGNEGIRVLANGNIAATNYVGIGTGTPNKQLHIKTLAGSNAEIDIQSGTDLNWWGIYQDDGTNDLRLWFGNATLGTNKVTFDDNGNVGIGTESPSAKLEVAGDLEITNLENNAGANFFGSDCGLDNYVYGVNSDGTLDCRPDGDDLGNHTATQNIKTNNFWLSNDGGSEGIFVAADGTTVILSNSATNDSLTVDGSIDAGVNTSKVALKVGGIEALWYDTAGQRFSWGYGATSNYFADRIGIGVQPDDTLVMLNVTGNTLTTGKALTTGTAISKSGNFANGHVSCGSIANITDWNFDCVSPTRIARNGAFYTREGRMNISNAKYKNDLTFPLLNFTTLLVGVLWKGFAFT